MFMLLRWLTVSISPFRLSIELIRKIYDLRSTGMTYAPRRPKQDLISTHIRQMLQAVLHIRKSSRVSSARIGGGERTRLRALFVGMALAVQIIASSIIYFPGIEGIPIENLPLHVTGIWST